MNEVLQTNVFFVITSIAALVLTVLIAIVLIYFIRILRNVRDITNNLKRGSERLADDALSLRSFVQESAQNIMHQGIVGTVISAVGSLLHKAPRKPKRKHVADDDE